MNESFSDKICQVADMYCTIELKKQMLAHKVKGEKRVMSAGEQSALRDLVMEQTKIERQLHDLMIDERMPIVKKTNII